MTPTTITLSDGTEVPLHHDGHGLTGRHDGATFYLSVVNANRSTATTPSHARWSNA